MESRRILVVGDSLFAESLVATLSTARDVEVIGLAASPQDAVSSVKEFCPDAVIFADSEPDAFAFIGELTEARPGLTILHADLRDQRVQVVTSHTIAANVTDLLATIAHLSQGSEPDV